MIVYCLAALQGSQKGEVPFCHIITITDVTHYRKGKCPSVTLSPYAQYILVVPAKVFKHVLILLDALRQRRLPGARAQKLRSKNCRNSCWKRPSGSKRKNKKLIDALRQRGLPGARAPEEGGGRGALSCMMSYVMVYMLVYPKENICIYIYIYTYTYTYIFIYMY